MTELIKYTSESDNNESSQQSRRVRQRISKEQDRVRRKKVTKTMRSPSEIIGKEQDTNISSVTPKTNYEQENLSEDSERSEKNKIPGGNKTIMNKQVPAIAAWREIFRKYRIRSIQQANTTKTTQTTKIQPILIKQANNEAIGDDFHIADEGFGLAETNIEWNNFRTKAIMQATTRKHFAHSIMMTSTTTMKFDEEYKPGGTCTVITNNWTGRSLQQIEDTTGQGRWSGTIIRGHWFNVAIITAYRVTQSAIEQAGPTTAYAQQWAVSRLHGNNRPEPRKDFIRDIKRLLQQLKKDGNKIILMIDANEAMGKDKNGISTVASDCDLIDVHTSRHNEAATTATYA